MTQIHHFLAVSRRLDTDTCRGKFTYTLFGILGNGNNQDVLQMTKG